MFGTDQKFFIGEYFIPDEIRLERPLNYTTRQNNVEFVKQTLFRPTTYLYTYIKDTRLSAPDENPITIAELRTAVYMLNDPKTLGD